MEEVRAEGATGVEAMAVVMAGEMVGEVTAVERGEEDLEAAGRVVAARVGVMVAAVKAAEGWEVAVRAAAVRAAAVRAVAVREAAARESEEMALVAERAEERRCWQGWTPRQEAGGPRDSCAA